VVGICVLVSVGAGRPLRSARILSVSVIKCVIVLSASHIEEETMVR
jgi:hypothetical protein